MKTLGHGANYQYAHDAPNAVVDQPHFPDTMPPPKLYQPVKRGFERTLGERIDWLQAQKNRLKKRS